MECHFSPFLIFWNQVWTGKRAYGKCPHRAFWNGPFWTVAKIIPWLGAPKSMSNSILSRKIHWIEKFYEKNLFISLKFFRHSDWDTHNYVILNFIAQNKTTWSADRLGWVQFITENCIIEWFLCYRSCFGWIRRMRTPHMIRYFVRFSMTKYFTKWIYWALFLYWRW